MVDGAHDLAVDVNGGLGHALDHEPHRVSVQSAEHRVQIRENKERHVRARRASLKACSYIDHLRNRKGLPTWEAVSTVQTEALVFAGGGGCGFGV
jgi:hypothetical protein